jgi:site-specific DNA-methyltransferase (adenine-specific)
MQIKPYSKNAKKHPKKQIEQVANSIKEFGMNQPIVVDKQGVIIVGHGRYEALQLLGWEVKPEWIKVVDLTEEQANAYRLADNKLNESEWDMSLVIEELKGLSPEMLNLTGFDTDLIIEPDEKDDEVPEPPEEPKSKLGDLYELGGHRVLCGDSTDLEAISALTGDIKVDMVFIDPPYNVDYEGSNGLKIENDNKSNEDFYQFLLEAYSSCALSMKLGAAIYVCHADLEGLNFRKAFVDAGFELRSCIIWNKNAMVMGRADYQWKHEPILYGWRAGGTHVWHGDRKQTTVWDMQKPSKNGEHPTMKPIELIEKALFNSSKQGDIVMDIFLGSGSTLIASEKTGRICYGMELDPKYTDVIVQRYVDYTGNENIKLNGEDIIWKKTQK